jgi:protease-4
MFIKQAPPARSFRWAIFTALATVVVAISLLLNLVLVCVVAAQADLPSAPKQTVLFTGDATQEIGVIEVKGVIMPGTFEKFDSVLTTIEADKNLKALILDIDTPGGAVTPSDQIYHRVMAFKSRMKEENRTVPVVASIGGMGTSGGYFVACSADYILAERTGLTGNIGVILPRFNVSKLAEKYGVEETTITSTGATYKNAGSMFKPEDPKDTAYIQKIADDAFATFKSVVQKSRQGKLKFPMATVADGRAFMAPEALTMGLIDQVGTANDAYAYAATAAKLSKPQIIRYEAPKTALETLLGGSQSKSNIALQFDGNALKVDSAAIEQLVSPRLMYLWRGE